MERNLVAIFHDCFLLPLPTSDRNSLPYPTHAVGFSPWGRGFSGQTVVSPETDTCISVSLNPAEKCEVLWTNHTPEAPISPTD